jgi:hypothetical protein
MAVSATGAVPLDADAGVGVVVEVATANAMAVVPAATRTLRTIEVPVALLMIPLSFWIGSTVTSAVKH